MGWWRSQKRPHEGLTQLQEWLPDPCIKALRRPPGPDHIRAESRQRSHLSRLSHLNLVLQSAGQTPVQDLCHQPAATLSDTEHENCACRRMACHTPQQLPAHSGVQSLQHPLSFPSASRTPLPSCASATRTRAQQLPPQLLHHS